MGLLIIKHCINTNTIDSSITHIRPRFKLVIPHKQQELLERLQALIENPPKELKGKIVDDHIILDVVEEYQHYWSPQLNFRVEQDETDESKAIVSGLIGPRPAVWTMFMFIYFFIGVMGFFISSYGISKWILGEYSHWILALPLAILFMLSAYWTGKYGEYLAKDQIEMLKQFVRDAIFY